MIRFSIKQRKESGKWELLPASMIAGKPLREAFMALDGLDVVAEFEFDQVKCYFCGTEYWLERMAAKGQAMRFSVAVKHLEKIRPALLDEIIPGIDTVEAVFPGCSLESFTAN